MNARSVLFALACTILLAFAVDGHAMGSEFLSDTPPVIEVEVVGTAQIERVDVTKNTRVVHSVAGDGGSVSFRWTDPSFRPGDSAFYFVRALQVDGEEAVSSPVWISPPIPAAADLSIQLWRAGHDHPIPALFDPLDVVLESCIGKPESAHVDGIRRPGLCAVS